MQNGWSFRSIVGVVELFARNSIIVHPFTRVSSYATAISDLNGTEVSCTAIDESRDDAVTASATIIDIIDYVTGIGNSSREQFSYVVTAVVLSVSPSNSPKSATADAIAHAKL